MESYDLGLDGSADELVAQSETLLARLAGRDDVLKWEAMERLYMAHLESARGSRDARKTILAALAARFPASKRVSRLTLLDVEADGLHKSAYNAYSKMNDAFGQQRIIAMFVKEGDRPRAIEALCEYLEIHQADAAAWRELRDLYEQDKLFDKALYCSEEVMLAHPNNAAVLTHHGELLSCVDDTALARKYYCLAAEAILSAGEERTNKDVLLQALQGVILCCGEGEHVKLRQWAEAKLRKVNTD